MALTAIEQLQIVSGEIKPPSVLLVDLVHQVAFMYAKVFMDGYKVFDPVGNEVAASYLAKMTNFSNQVFIDRQATFVNLQRIVVVILGVSEVTPTQIANGTDEQWETFVTDQMDESFEYASGSTKEEKTAYLALP